MTQTIDHATPAATSPATPPTKKQGVRPARLIAVITFFALCIAGGVAMAGAVVHGSSSNDAQVKAMTAFDMCQKSVRDHLKAPGSAKFRDYSGDQAPSVSGSGNGPYTVISTVDSQNGFGALIRSNFVCTAEYIGSDQWHVSSTVG